MVKNTHVSAYSLLITYFEYFIFILGDVTQRLRGRFLEDLNWSCLAATHHLENDSDHTQKVWLGADSPEGNVVLCLLQKHLKPVWSVCQTMLIVGR